MPAMLKAMRPKQWVKNLFVIAPIVFAKSLMVQEMALRSVAAFFCFCMAASCIYMMNDLSDIEADRAHPKKRFRPIASGEVSEKSARVATVALGILALTGAALLNLNTLAVVGGYIALQIAYTFALKRVPYVDVFCIALGFELRVLAGTFAIGVQPSVYLLIVTALLSLFLGFGKRMHELNQGKGNAAKQRSVLARYDARVVNALLQLTALATTGTYVMYTLDPHTREMFGTDYLAATIVFTEFGVIRFLELVRRSDDAESPTDQMLRDIPFILNLFLWAVAVVVVIYVT